MRHLVRAFWNDATRTYVWCKASSEPSPCGLMIVWALVRRASEICTCPYRSWWLPLRALRHRLWDSPCSETCWDCIYPVKAFIIFRTSYFVWNFTQMLLSRTGEIQETHAAGSRICHNHRLHAFSLDHLWDTTCSCSLTQSSCLWASYAFSRCQHQYPLDKREFSQGVCKVKTYSDLLVLRQDANDMLGETARWVLHVSYFHKSTYSDVDKARSE